MKLLRIYLGEKDVKGGKPLAEYIVELAYKSGLNGITVCKGIIGFGKKRHIHRSDFFTLSEDLPIVIDIVDEKEKIAEFIEKIKLLNFDGLIVEVPVNAYYVEKKE
ncbi:MAG: DUF190 domain-containing protein [Thermosipho sp. (in: Bacteria)]|nr:DUF190 domain-containing protein [Thermosipho sp. (in: thermotogales)]